MTTTHTRETLAKFQRPLDLDASVAAELESAQERGLPLKAIAADMGITRNRMYDLAGERGKLWFSEVPRLMRSVGSYRLLEDLARTVGAIVVFLRPVASSGHSDIYESFARAAAEMADVPRTLAQRLEDGELSIDDAEAIARDIDEWISAGVAMRDLVMRKAQVLAQERRR